MLRPTSNIQRQANIKISQLILTLSMNSTLSKLWYISHHMTTTLATLN